MRRRVFYMDCYVFQDLVLKKGYQDEDVIEILYDFVNMVIYRHFSYVSAELKRDLTSEGICKVIQMLKAELFDPKISTLVNFLYTGVRNELTNFMHRMKREILVDDPVMFCSEKSMGSSSAKVVISFEKLKELLGKFAERVGGCIFQVIDALKEIGIQITGICDIVKTDKCFNERVVDQLKCLVIWKMQESYQL